MLTWSSACHATRQQGPYREHFQAHDSGSGHAAVGPGQLDLDAPVQQYVPYFPEKRWPVTTRQLGGHLGGVRHYRGAEFQSAKPYASVEEGIAIFAVDTLLHEPGSQFHYSSYAWNLISAVIEGASSQPFLEVMQAEVFGPLGLAETVADHADSIIVQRVRFYERNNGGGFANAPYVDNSYKWAGGGFLSSVENMVRFAHAHLDDAYLSDAARVILFTSQTTTSEVRTGYGFGWEIADDAGYRYILHGGGLVVGSTRLLMQSDTQVVVALHVNLTAFSTQGITSRVASLLVHAAAND